MCNMMSLRKDVFTKGMAYLTFVRSRMMYWLELKKSNKEIEILEFQKLFHIYRSPMELLKEVMEHSNES